MLNDNILGTLKRRNRHFDFNAVSGQLAPDQPENGLHQMDGQGSFPALRLANAVLMFPDRDRRPMQPVEAGGGPMKAKAPSGVRRPLHDTLEPEELLVVEGEGDYLAALSVKLRGVVCAGGVNTFTSNRGHAPRIREGLFRGKSVRILFDPDEAGREHARKVALKLYEAGATRVAIAELPTEDQDLEDFIGSFDTPEAAYVDLTRLLGKAPWLRPEDLKDDPQGAPEAVQSARVHLPGADQPVLVCMTWQPEDRRAGLAVYAPHEALDGNGQGGEQYPREVDCSGPWTWLTCDEWSFRGRTYEPDTSAPTLKLLDRGALVLTPPPHEGPDTSEQLWRDTGEFLRRWVMLGDDRLYAALTAYAFMTWRLHDARFPAAPLLRISGPPGSGKGRLLKCLKELCWRSFAGQTTADNIHWLVECFGDVTQLFDEFHTDRGRTRDAQERIVDVLNHGFERDGTVLRIIGEKPKTFSVFGARILAGYGHDEHEALARRTLAVRMAGSPDVPEEMDLPALPAVFYEQGAELRSRLLAWRGRKLRLGLPDPEGGRYRELRQRAGREVGQGFWPLVEMVPADLADELEAVMLIAEERRGAVEAARGADLIAYLLAEVARLVEAGQALEQKDGRAWVVPTRMLVDQADDPRVSVTTLPALLGLEGAGLAHGQFRLREPSTCYGARPMGFRVPKQSDALAAVMRRHGVDWPPDAVEREEAAL